MRMEEYLDTVTEQIRCARARDFVREEMEAHIRDQAEAYEVEGMFPEEALEKAVCEMGDPVEAGVALDGVHRPRMDWHSLWIVGILSLLSVAAQLLLSQEYSLGNSLALRHILFTVTGFALMLLIYRLDYSVLAKYGRQAAGVVLLLLALALPLGIRMNGSVIGLLTAFLYIPLSALTVLYVPLFGAVLYSYRGQGYRCLWKIFLWVAVPVLLMLRLTYFSRAALFGLMLAAVLAFAIGKDWYMVAKRKALAFLGGVAVLLPAVGILFLGVSGRLTSYQLARLAAFVSGSSETAYTEQVARQFLTESSLVGLRGGGELYGTLPGANSEYILVSIAWTCGLAAAVAVVLFLLSLIGRVFRIALRQRNQLGMILGFGCGVVFLSQTLLTLAMTLGLSPVMSTVLPFFSQGGSNVICSYILLGLVLSVYRYKDILPGKEAGQGRSVSPVGLVAGEAK
ncbi:MAG: FtsW/RodA/SpoVE family cell cycle protein [Lachnospiraceae bacterium]|nr:FtsW/RodA/SpoVE family cell cycle protein [Lachnospiraceae bacterium]